MYRLLTLAALSLGSAHSRAGELLDNQIFDRYSPLVAADEFSRRVFSPTTHDRLQRYQAHTGIRAVAHTVDLSKERFDLFIPKTQPAKGYGLIVFVSPIQRWPLTHDWKKVLDRTGYIYVSALRSGNEQNVYKRRIPLALHALENVKARYPIDPDRVVISGFSGGSRTAIRIAAGYADVFSGALLIGGAKVMGEEDFAPPPLEIMAQLQRKMRVVYSTGRHDMPNQRLDGRSIAALQERCVAGVFRYSERDISHEVPDFKTMRRVLNRLETALDAQDLEQQAECARTLALRIDGDVGAAQIAFRAGDTAQAGELLGAADLAWGGLAAEPIVELARQLAPGFSDAPTSSTSQPDPDQAR